MEAAAGDPDRLAASRGDDTGPGLSTHEDSESPESERFCDATPRSASRRRRWARLLQRVFDIDALACPRCGCTLRLIAAIEDPAVAHRILECLGLPARAPPLEPAPLDDGSEQAYEEASWEYDQTPSYDKP